jgi:hypothetical protein
MKEAMIKGGVLREFVHWYVANHGAERLADLAEHLPDDLRSTIDPHDRVLNLLASSWYPSRFCNVMLDRVSAGLSEREIEQMARDANRWLLARSTSSVYRFALRRLVSPELYAASVPRLWRQFHSTGQRHVRVDGNTARSRVFDWAGHHPVLCTITIETMCAVLETMGCRDVKWRRTACVARGAKECITLVEWR